MVRTVESEKIDFAMTWKENFFGQHPVRTFICNVSSGASCSMSPKQQQMWSNNTFIPVRHSFSVNISFTTHRYASTTVAKSSSVWSTPRPFMCSRNISVSGILVNCPNLISISKKTRHDLSDFITSSNHTPLSQVCANWKTRFNGATRYSFT